MDNREPSPEATAHFARLRAELEIQRALLPKIRAEGEEALRRLLPVAKGDTGQSRRIARFLLGLYNGDRFRFDLTDLRGLDREVFDDCLTVLRMDHSPEKEVHRYFDNGGDLFEQLATDWGWTQEEHGDDHG